LFVKIDLATDSGSEYDRDEKKIGLHFFHTCVTGSILKKSKMAAVILVKYTFSQKNGTLFSLTLILSHSEPESVAQSILTSKKSESCFYDK